MKQTVLNRKEAMQVQLSRNYLSICTEGDRDINTNDVLFLLNETAYKADLWPVAGTSVLLEVEVSDDEQEEVGSDRV